MNVCEKPPAIQRIPTRREMEEALARRIGPLPMVPAAKIVCTRVGCTDPEARTALQAVWKSEWHHKRVRRHGILVPTGIKQRWYPVDDAIELLKSCEREVSYGDI